MTSTDMHSQLDSDSEIKTAEDYKSTLQILTNQKKPSQVLVQLMTLLEKYRQKRKLGWSRPWNKYGLLVFKSFVLDFTKDSNFINEMRKFLDSLSLSENNILAFKQLSENRNSKGFLFCHDFTDSDFKTYEGVTFSIGKIAPESPRHRDRFDIILEREIIDGVSTGNIRARIYNDPYLNSTEIPKMIELRQSSEFQKNATNALESCVLKYCQWKNEPHRHWSHWTQNYIYYFGKRSLKVNKSIFEKTVNFNYLQTSDSIGNLNAHSAAL